VYPNAHAKPQVLPEQRGVSFPASVVHWLPHEPQLLTLVVVSTHNPLQKDWPFGQGATQAEPEQLGVPASALQACPHEPQLLLSLVVSTHPPLQSVYPLLHVNVHAPLPQAAAALATLVAHCMDDDWYRHPCES
jgi:hypothetical protein